MLNLRASTVTLIALAAVARAGTGEEFGGAKMVDAGRLRAHLEFIASDLLEGRDTPSRGLDIAARYIAANMERLGLKPMGTNDYFQSMPIGGSKIDTGSTASIGGTEFKYGEGFLARAVVGKMSGQIAYVGFGIVHKAKNIDSYSGTDVKGKIVLVLSGLPEGVTQREMRADGDGIEDVATAAAKRGATGIVMIPRSFDIQNWQRTLERANNSGVRGRTDGLPELTASKAMLEAIVAGSGMTADELIARSDSGNAGSNAELKGTLTANIGLSGSAVTTQNVIAVWEGSDPVLKNEYVAVGAHYDHVGMRPSEGDGIYNGADDDGSGTVALMEMAEVLTRNPRPKRSVLFVWHTGEEKGLVGSAYFVANPTVPLDKIVAQLNIDMIGRSKPEGDTNERNKMLTAKNEIYVIGSDKISNDIKSTIESVNGSINQLKLNYWYDRPNDPEQLYFRSDHYNYAQKGIPIAFFFDGVHVDYHGVGDHVEKIDFEKMEWVTETVYGALYQIANNPQRPRPNKSG